MTASGSNAPGRFITVEGIEGVGKSTNIAWIANWLRKAGMRVVETREPGGTALAESIRDLVLRAGSGAVPPDTELLLMFAARAAHLDGLVRPRLAAGDWVVCDRFTDASYAYQGGGRGVPAGDIAALERIVQRGLSPDLTLLLDLSLEASEARRAGRGPADRFEQEDREFFERVRAAYLARAAAEPARVRVVDAGRPLDEVRATLADILEEFVENKD